MIIKRCATKGAFEAIPDKTIRLNLHKLKINYKHTIDMPMLLAIKCQEHNVTCYKYGKLMIENVKLKKKQKK